LNKEEYLTRIERRLSKHALIATWDQREHNVKAGPINFDLVVKGDTSKISIGIFARLLASALLPKQKVAVMIAVVEREKPMSVEGLMEIANSAKEYMIAEKLRWVWLVVAAFEDFPANTLTFAEEYYEKNIAIILVNLRKEKVSAFTHSGLGRSGSGLLKP